MHGSLVTPFPNEDVLHEFLTRIRDAENKQDLEKISIETFDVVSVLDRNRLTAAKEAYGMLKGQFQLRYPGC